MNKNTISTLNLIEFGITNKIKKIIYASSMSVYGSVPDKPISEVYNCKPLSCYGVSKLSSENYLEVFKSRLPYISFRMFNVYGPGQDMDNLRQGMVSIYLSQALKNNSVEVKGSLQRFRDFIYIDDVVDVWVKAALNDVKLNEVINLGTGLKSDVKYLLNLIQHSFPNLVINETSPTPGDQSGIYADTTKLREIFGISEFTNLKDGLLKFIEYERRIGK